MAQIKTLPLFPGAKFIVVDDGEEVMRSHSLILGWLQMWDTKGLGNTVEFLLFSGPKSIYEDYTQHIKNIDIKVHDCYTTFIDDRDKNNDVAKLERILNGNILQVNSVLIVDCLSLLVLTVGLSKTIQFVEKLSSRCAQLICIYRRDFYENKVPRIETLGTTYVRLEKSSSYTYQGDNIQYQVFLNHRKQGGGILNERVQIFQEYKSDTYEIVRESILNNAPIEIGPSYQPEKPQATFRIEMNAREQEQRKNTPLPYSHGGTQNESQILYEPDSIDDLDEEDPDDDLPF